MNEDDIYINLIRQQNHEAYTLLEKKYAPIILSWVNKYMDAINYNKINIDDIIMQIKGKFPYFINEYDTHLGQFGSFLKSAVEREILKMIQKENTLGSKTLNSAVSLDENIDFDGDNTYLDSIASSYYINDFDSQLETNSNILKIKNYLDKIPLLEKEIFTMYINGYDYKEIASKLNLEVKKVDNVIYKVKSKLLLELG